MWEVGENDGGGIECLEVEAGEEAGRVPSTLNSQEEIDVFAVCCDFSYCPVS